MIIDHEDMTRWEVLRAQLRRRRIQLGFTQQDVSLRMGRSASYVAVLENSPKHIPNVRTIWAWLDALGMRDQYVPIEDVELIEISSAGSPAPDSQP